MTTENLSARPDELPTSDQTMDDSGSRSSGVVSGDPAPTDPAGAVASEAHPADAASEYPPETSAPLAVSDSGSSETAAASEKARRRVQLNPTYSPDIAKPFPSLAGQVHPAPPSGGASAPAPHGSGESTRTTAAALSEDVASDQADVEMSAATAEIPHTVAAEVAPPRRVEPVELPPRDEQLDAEIEAELNAALHQADEVETPVPDAGEVAPEEGSPALPPDAEVKQGTRLIGSVQAIHGDDMFIDLGLRLAGVLSRRQFGLRKQPMQGESITVIVNRVDEKEGLIHVNLPTGASRVRGNWEEIRVDQTVECVVSATNKGGLEVTVGSLRGFMPASQVELGFVADLSSYVGQKLRVQVTEVNPKRRKLVLSRRKLLEVERAQSEQEIFEKIAPGQTYLGRVKTIKDYGAFVDIGGVDGLLHVAQISWTRINHPQEVLTEGQQIEVKVLSVDSEKKKIGLGMRQLSQNPWKTAEEKYSAGTVVKGKVTRIENFGAFIELDPGLEGLVHISELDHQRIRTVHEVLRVGQEVDVQVLEVDPSRKRISLSVKALKQKPEEAPEPVETLPPVKRQSPESLKGGIGEPTGGQLFGDPRRFGR
ncbi:MAG: S1 RNA-binding domain-containing protein [Planctomycetaceae bacterium]|nr:S1 RNA-binding domain-containing protein [Planctomycetaceae bacterium]